LIPCRSSIEKTFSAPTSTPYLIPSSPSPSPLRFSVCLYPALSILSFSNPHQSSIPSIMPTFTPTELLGAHNYGTWAKEVEAYCMTQQGGDIWLAIDLDTEVPTVGN
jgi:hypothetical protein